MHTSIKIIRNNNLISLAFKIIKETRLLLKLSIIRKIIWRYLIQREVKTLIKIRMDLDLFQLKMILMKMEKIINSMKMSRIQKKLIQKTSLTMPCVLYLTNSRTFYWRECLRKVLSSIWEKDQLLQKSIEVFYLKNF